jgi:S-adenosylmethionine synthetase
MLKNFLFTSESVSAGHPDKICDQISDALVDAYLKLNNQSRLAIETFATTNQVIVGGEIRAPQINANDFENIIRQTVKNIGYQQNGFHYENLKITNLLHSQSSDIAIGVDATEKKEEGAGDQGIMFGYACNETSQLMPAPLYYAHRILYNIIQAVKNKQIPNFGPDAKSQVTLQYFNNQPVEAKIILVSIQHPQGFSAQQILDIIKPYIINSLPQGWVTNNTQFLVNPTGQFIIGGPDGDAGLTGRKIIVDTYGGSAPHGGGAFSGKDPTKVDRSAAYMARYLAKNIVSTKLVEKCTIQLSYAIGISKPLSLYINTHNSSLNDEKLVNVLNSLIDLSPKGIRTYLELNKPIYQKTAAYGHFGRDPENDGSFSWEKTDLAPKILQLL